VVLSAEPLVLSAEALLLHAEALVLYIGGISSTCRTTGSAYLNKYAKGFSNRFYLRFSFDF